MQWTEYYQTVDYIREAQDSLSRNLGITSRKAQLKELKNVILRLEKLMRSIVDQDVFQKLEQLKQNTASCYNKVMYCLMNIEAKRSHSINRVA